jgi:hypothetical protein
MSQGYVSNKGVVQTVHEVSAHLLQVSNLGVLNGSFVAKSGALLDPQSTTVTPFPPSSQARPTLRSTLTLALNTFSG